MAGLAEVAAAMIRGAEHRLDVIAGNIGNVSTPGYETRRAFSRVLDIRDPMVTNITEHLLNPVHPPAMKLTGNSGDLASGAGVYFAFRGADGVVRTSRSAQLVREADGRLVDRTLGALQAAGGGDVAVDAGVMTVLRDGTVLVEGKPEAKVGFYLRTGVAGDDGPGEEGEGIVHQGMLVASDVDLGAEMVELTRTSRLAETGAKVFQMHDDLMGRLLTRLGEFRV